MPMVNELECHPFLQQHEVRNYCRENNIQLIAHTPTGKMSSADSDALKKIADSHGVTVSQVILRWHYQLGNVVIPNTSNISHATMNMNILGFELSDKEMNQIRELDCNKCVWPDPDNRDFNKL